MFFVKELGHCYPNWAPTEHWNWLKQYRLNGVSATVDDIENSNSFNFYPNPCKDKIHFNNKVNYTIFDIGGRIFLKDIDNSVSMYDLPKGMSFVNDGKISRKLVVIKD
ncbi:MAG: T9SS type A sorting domain-containing protein [Saprospiraceae bacterium]|nr:T9SS type A sorting domain-containing protein [Saprospiraceae bacterium]